MTTSSAPDSLILTPDQRPRVFLSSTLQELAAERAAARAAIDRLHLIPVMFELGARPHPARALYRAYLAQSHVFVGLYFERYGWVAPDENVSGLEDEYRLSGGLPRLIYLKTPAPEREPRLGELLDTVRADDTVSYKSFKTPEELEKLLTEDLAVLMAERFLLAGQEGAPSQTSKDDPVALASTRPIPTPVDSLVGREEELAELHQLLSSDNRLVTVVGPGGIGKTRLTLETARRAAARRPGQVVFVPLEAIDDPADVLPAVASAIGLGLDSGVPVLDALLGAFGDRPFTLVLDNFEQVLPAATELVDLLTRCRCLVVLVTSRAALRVRGETLFPLGPLSLPDEGVLAGESAAVRLFVDRAQAVRPGFSLDRAEDAEAVEELCRRLEGIPLAIELAAGRSRLLPPVALLERLGSALDLGSGAVDLPARQRTLRDTLAWSEQLLEPQQRGLLGALSVFSAPWTVADAGAVSPQEVTDALEDVAALVENSLVTPAAQSPGEPRFRVFDTVRAYAGERLDALGDRASVDEAFVARMLDQVDGYVTGCRSPDQARWRAEFRLVWPDLRRAWTLALEHRDGRRTAIATQLVIPLWLDGRNHEVQDLVDRSVRLGAATRPAEHGELVLMAAHSAFYLGHYEQVAELLSQFDTGAVPLPTNPDGVGGMQLLRAYLAVSDGDLATSERLLAESATTLQESMNVGARWVEAFSHNGVGSLTLVRGDLAGANEAFEKSRRLAEDSGNISAQMQALVFMAGIALVEGRRDDAQSLLLEAIPAVEQQPFYEGNGYGLEVAAAYGLAGGNAVEAARALGLAKALRDMIGAKVWALLEGASEATHTSTRAALGDEAFETAYGEGLAADPRTSASTMLGLLDTG